MGTRHSAIPQRRLVYSQRDSGTEYEIAPQGDEEPVALACSLCAEIKSAALAAAPSFQREHSRRACCGRAPRTALHGGPAAGGDKLSPLRYWVSAERSACES